MINFGLNAGSTEVTDLPEDKIIIFHDTARSYGPLPGERSMKGLFI